MSFVKNGEQIIFRLKQNMTFKFEFDVGLGINGSQFKEYLFETPTKERGKIFIPIKGFFIDGGEDIRMDFKLFEHFDNNQFIVIEITTQNYSTNAEEFLPMYTVNHECLKYTLQPLSILLIEAAYPQLEEMRLWKDSFNAPYLTVPGNLTIKVDFVSQFLGEPTIIKKKLGEYLRECIDHNAVIPNRDYYILNSPDKTFPGGIHKYSIITEEHFLNLFKFDNRDPLTRQIILKFYKVRFELLDEKSEPPQNKLQLQFHPQPLSGFKRPHSRSFGGGKKH